ncbi:hypothetical protein C0992_003410 [Termitomyces sp. T32_za158]|nr:hypothetical protein C0992_003410 [Termitomyces sp. T32_za158]
MTDEQHAQLLHGLEEVRRVIGDEYVSGLSDNELKDTLWEYFFDTEKTIHWALEEQERRQIARERKEPNTGKGLPFVPQEPDEGHSNAEYYHPEQYNIEGSGPPRGPLILLHQTPAQALEMETPRGIRTALSTITERTECTETTPRLPSGRKLISHRSSRPSSTFTVSSYGQVIDETDHTFTPYSGDPNSIPVSPPLSALNELSLEPALSIAASDSASVRPSRAQRKETSPPNEGLSDVSKFHKQPASPAPPPRQSKLSRLASSRASSISTRSESSRSSGITLNGSVKTFPALRPSPQSLRPPSSEVPSNPPSSCVASTAPGANQEYYNPPMTETLSRTSSLVRRAINTAMTLEALDNAAAPDVACNVPIHPTTAPASSTSAGAKSPAQLQAQLLPTVSPAASPTSPESPRIYKEVDTYRTPSKLALLAQKSSANRAAKVPKSVTEYLTPAANGPTATTAITTSIQTLRSLTDPTRSRVMPALEVVPFGATPPVHHPPVKGSKLAEKIRMSYEKHSPIHQKEDDAILSMSPVFHPGSAALVRASPSAFASLLVDDAVSEEKTKYHSSPHQVKEDSLKSIASTSSVNEHAEKRKYRSTSHRNEKPPVPDISAPAGFKFDGPSPDDLVMTARRGTSLQKDSPSPALRKITSTK